MDPVFAREKFIRKVGDVPAYFFFRWALVLYATFFFDTFPVRDFSSFFSAPALPLFDISVFHSALFAAFVKALYLVSLGALLVGYRVALSGLLAGTALLLHFQMFPLGVSPFHFYAPLLFFAFAVEEATRKGDPAPPRELPLIFLTVTIYLASVAHKITHFPLMIRFWSLMMSTYERPEFLHVCPGASCSAMQMMAYLVIPGETALGLLFLCRRTRPLALLVFLGVHAAMYTVLALLNIGVMLALTHCCAGLLACEWTLRDLVSSRRLRGALLSLAPLFVLTGALAHWSGAGPELAFRVMSCLIALSPLVAVAACGFSASLSRPRTWRPADIRAPHAAFLLWLALFAAAPALDGYRKLTTVGWQIYSGASFQNPQAYFSVPAAQCNEAPMPPLVRSRRVRGSNVYASFDPELLRRFSELTRTACPRAEISSRRERIVPPVKDDNSFVIAP